jgi:hypothetical protein
LSRSIAASHQQCILRDTETRENPGSGLQFKSRTRRA